MRAILGCCVLLAAGVVGQAWARSPVSVTEQVDFRYAPPWWESAICLPDDPEKPLVGKEGQLLMDFPSGASWNLSAFGINAQPDIEGGAAWVRQQTVSARVPIVQTWKDANGVKVLEEAFVVTPPSRGSSPAWHVAILVTLNNTTAAQTARRPLLRIHGAGPVVLKDGVVLVGDKTRIAATGPIVSCEANADPATKEFVVALAPLELKPGASGQFAFIVDRNQAGGIEKNNPVADVVGWRDAAVKWWAKADLPFTTIEVPDAGIQDMLESCVRNIWQAREMKDGKPAFHVGHTAYRGLWTVDGAFLLETAALLGRSQDARAGLEYLLGQQNPLGSAEAPSGFWKANGIVLWAAARHAMLTQDKQWLRAQWPALRNTVKAIRVLRTKASANDKALEYQLLPAGFVDGGIATNDKPEYSNVCWCLAGLKVAIDAAHWLDEDVDATAWQKEFDDFYAVFRKACERDTLKDKHGNAYVPTMMGNADNLSPQKGQWAFCHAIYPGQIFPADDPLVSGQLAMLRDTMVEGMVFDTGWMNDGIWTYFASFYGHAMLLGGDGCAAARSLYDFANHAAPTRLWREEQKPVGQDGPEVGDMPHNWASAEFIRLTTHLLEFDRGDELHLLEGMPIQWLRASMMTKLNGVATPFGPLQMTVQVDQSGKTATLDVKPLKANCKSIVVHLPDGTVRCLSPEKGGALTFDVPETSKK